VQWLGKRLGLSLGWARSFLMRCNALRTCRASSTSISYSLAICGRTGVAKSLLNEHMEGQKHVEGCGPGRPLAATPCHATCSSAAARMQPPLRRRERRPTCSELRAAVWLATGTACFFTFFLVTLACRCGTAGRPWQ